MKRLTIILTFLAIALSAVAVPVRIVPPNFGSVVATDGKGVQYPARDEAYDLPQGTLLTLIYTPKNDCSVFAEWQCVGGVIDNNNQLTIGSQETIIYARFQIVQYTIEAQVLPADAGRARVRCGVGDIFLDVAGSVNCGSTIQLIASEDETNGFKFTQWDDGVTDPIRIVQADDDHTYIAYFRNPQQATGSDNVQITSKPQKYIENGLLKINANGSIYNSQGHKINN
ncbi:MAG: hypothetical protein K5660_03910 [Paludibacteraceae bacterium]|nr:hypothetical protein [Paludibacteraceae bacterium]